MRNRLQKYKITLIRLLSFAQKKQKTMQNYHKSRNTYTAERLQAKKQDLPYRGKVCSVARVGHDPTTSGL